MLTISITGATGFVGTHLTKHFELMGNKVIKITREDLSNLSKLTTIIERSDIVINLAGANIIHRWSEEYKKLLYSSRINTTQNLVEAINKSAENPKLFISTSAVGIYNNQKTHSEEHGVYSNDFLSTLCQEWEEEAKKAQTRVVIFRFGIVLGTDGGALQQMMTPFKLGLGGNIGNGKQAFSFIHIEDLLNAFDFAIKHHTLQDTYNLCANIPTTNAGLTKALGKAINRPTFLPLPKFVLQLIFGEGAKVLTDGQAAIPKRLEEAGFEFKYKNIDEALKHLCKHG